MVRVWPTDSADGFEGSPYTCNLKDLLVEIVLSKWLRADAVMDADPVSRVALAPRRRQAVADAGGTGSHKTAVPSRASNGGARYPHELLAAV